ncbi:hypothetical protein FHS93_002874 [Sphingobium francense]|nr:hypothetical protein [Sphingobium indicum]
MAGREYLAAVAYGRRGERQHSGAAQLVETNEGLGLIRQRGQIRNVGKWP